MLLTIFTKSWNVMAEVFLSWAFSTKISLLFGVISLTNSGVFRTSTKSSQGISPNPSGSYCKKVFNSVKLEHQIWIIKN